MNQITAQQIAALRDEAAQHGDEATVKDCDRANRGSKAAARRLAAARLSDGWMFVRIRQELQRAQWAGDPPWEGLHVLAKRLDLGELRRFLRDWRQLRRGSSVEEYHPSAVIADRLVAAAHGR